MFKGNEFHFKIVPTLTQIVVMGDENMVRIYGTDLGGLRISG